MASTNKTPHLGLNQWILDDPFLMEDCNADNQKLDTAVKVLQGKTEFVKLKTVTTQDTPNGILQVDVGVSDIDFNAWQFVIMDTDTPESCTVRVNGLNTGNWRSMGSVNGSSGGLLNVNVRTRVIFFPNLGATYVISAMAQNSGLLFGNVSRNFSELTTLNFVASETWPLKRSCKFTFWGVR